MKLSFSTLGCPTWSWKQILQFAKDQAYNGIEIRGVQDAMTAQSLRFVLESEESFTKDFLLENPIQLICLGTSIKLHDTDKWPDSLHEFDEYLSLCRKYKIPAIRVFGDKIGEEDSSVVINRVIERLHVLCALSPDINIYLEIHGDFSTIETLAPIMEAMVEDNFGIIWDVEHSDGTYGDDFEPFYDLIFPKIKHVHIKDRVRGNGLCLIGEGDIPLERIIHRLVSDGYEGYFSIEWEKRWKAELAEPSIALSRYASFMRKLEQ